MNRGFKGNKAALPTKTCATCGRPMSWRKAWAKNWEQVRHCSDACRANKARTRSGGTGGTGGTGRTGSTGGTGGGPA